MKELANASMLIRRDGKPSGTGTIVKMDSNDYWIFTAQHVAKNMDNKTVFVFSIDDKPHQIAISLLKRKQTDSWYAHWIADIAILKIKIPNDTVVAKHIKKYAFPGSQIFGGKESFDYGTVIDFYGYPATDRKWEYFTPFHYETTIACGLLTSKRGNTNQLCTFFYLNTPSVQGCSGSGVFLGVDKKVRFGRADMTYMVGIIHGTFPDNTGGKMAAVTPMFYIKDGLVPLK